MFDPKFDPDRVKELRKQLLSADIKATQDSFAKLIGSERSGYSKKERGKTDFTADEIGKLISGLKNLRSPEFLKNVILYFFGLSDSPEIDNLFYLPIHEVKGEIKEEPPPFTNDIEVMLSKTRTVLQSNTPYADLLKRSIMSLHDSFLADQMAEKKKASVATD